MFVMYDSVTLSEIPRDPHAVAAYVDGHFANYKEALVAFPHARLLGISTGSRVATDCYDIETGDYHPDEAGHLWHIAADMNVWKPCFYANLSTMPAVKASLDAAGISRNAYRLWVASWDDTTIIPEGYDAKQFTDRALGRNLDESVCRSDFFRPAPVKPKPVGPKVFGTLFDNGTWHRS